MVYTRTLCRYGGGGVIHGAYVGMVMGMYVGLV